MKMQKLMYLAQGFYLVKDKGALVDELFEAWEFGPVLPTIYHACKEYGKDPITHPLPLDLTYLGDSRRGIYEGVYREIPDEEIEETLDEVWSEYGGTSAVALSQWTHEKDGPWDRVVHNQDLQFRNQPIDNEMIREYFVKIKGRMRKASNGR